MSRDELVEQSRRILSLSAEPSRVEMQWVVLARRMVDADWRPVTDDDTTVEKVARAIFGLPDEAWGQLHKDTQSDYRHEARAAIAALRGDSNV